MKYCAIVLIISSSYLRNALFRLLSYYELTEHLNSQKRASTGLQPVDFSTVMKYLKKYLNK